jgi:hypothetical protein
MPGSHDMLTLSGAPHKVRICLWKMYEGRNVGVRDGQREFSFFLSRQNFAQFGHVIFVSSEKREKQKRNFFSRVKYKKSLLTIFAFILLSVQT